MLHYIDDNGLYVPLGIVYLIAHRHDVLQSDSAISGTDLGFVALYYVQMLDMNLLCYVFIFITSRNTT